MQADFFQFTLVVPWGETGVVPLGETGEGMGRVILISYISAKMLNIIK